jgi:hypothetical protein
MYIRRQCALHRQQPGGWTSDGAVEEYLLSDAPSVQQFRDKPRQRIWTLVGLGSAIVMLMLLASGLTGITFRPGHMYDFGPLTLPTGTATPAPAAELRPPGWLSVVVTLIILATRVYRAIGVILSRSFRRELLVRTISMLIVIMLVDLG